MLFLSNFKQILLYSTQNTDCFKLCYVAVYLVFSKLQDPFSNLLRVVQQSALPVSLFLPSKPDTETHSFFNVSEHKLKIIYMYLLYLKEYCDIN